MIFSSFTFLWCFLPPLLVLYFSIKNKLFRNALLLVASIFFYAWGEPVYVFLMIASIIINYCFGLLIDASAAPAKRKFFTLLGTAVNVLILMHFKYTDFIIDNMNMLLNLGIDAKEIPLPIGISFYTFQAISYLVDIYRGDVKAQRSLLKMGLYISFFPQLIAGPIVKYHDIEQQLENRTVTPEMFNYGVSRFIFGFAKKILLANIVGKAADTIFALEAGDLSTPAAWVGAIAYSLQIYYDFSGYSDMAIGLGRMFGFTFQENFNYPYVSSSIHEFWQRWHISLATWFKLYVYIPLGGNRAGAFRTYLNTIIVFFLTGLWHGAAWNFVIWGLWNGVFLIFERAVQFDKRVTWGIIRHAYTLLIVVVGMVIFRTNSVHDAIVFLEHMFSFENMDVSYLNILVTNEPRLGIVAAVLCSGPLVLLWRSKKDAFLAHVPNIIKGSWLMETVKIVLFVVSILALAGNSYNPFIYFRF